MENLEKEVNDEIEKFKRTNVGCKRERDCLPFYIIKEKSVMHQYNKNNIADYISKGIGLDKKLDDKEREEIMEHVYSIADIYMRKCIYPEEKEVKHECNNSKCPVFCLVKAMNNGNNYINYQWFAMAVYKYKIGELEHRDIGMGDALLQRWINKKIVVDGKETTFAAEYQKAYQELEEDIRKRTTDQKT
ncbi:MAG: hypothetical protein V1660_00655 [archaeon]